MKKISSDLWSLFWTQFFGALNDNVFKNALIILITYQGVSLFGINSSALVALSGGVFILPFFFLSATSGQIADRFEKTMLVKIIKKFEILISMLAIMGLTLKNYPLLIFVLFLFGLHSTFFGPLKYSLIPNYTKKENLVFSNALISSGTFIAILIGTILGGLAASNQSNLWALKFLLVLFATLGLMAANRLKPLESSEVVTESTAVDWNFRTSTRDILKLVFKNSMVGILIIGLSWFWFLGAGLLSLLPLISKNIFHGNEHVATLMLFTFTIGMGVGPFALDRITSGRVYRALIPLSLIAMTFFIFDIALVLNLIQKQSSMMGILATLNGEVNIHDFFQLKMSTRIILDLFFLSLFGGVFTVPQFAELQRITSGLELSRIIAGNNIINALAMVSVSVLLMILHQQHLSLSIIFGVLGFLNMVMSVVLIFYYRGEFNKFWRF
ncbi:MAG: MFS transporter [Bacteriovorax sp.]|nr:MFS transporter [Bacteriovorax sp.]